MAEEFTDDDPYRQLISYSQKVVEVKLKFLPTPDTEQNTKEAMNVFEEIHAYNKITERFEKLLKRNRCRNQKRKKST